jgi:hypothetical protein
VAFNLKVTVEEFYISARKKSRSNVLKGAVTFFDTCDQLLKGELACLFASED